MSAPRRRSLFSDGGIRSRKMWFGVGVCLAMALGGLAAAKVATFAPSYEVFVGGLLGVYAIYCGGNVGAKVALKGTLPAQRREEKEEGNGGEA